MKTNKVLVAALLVAAFMPFHASAKMGYMKKLKAQYASTKVAEMDCAICHTDGNTDNKNQFALDFLANYNGGTPNWAALEQLDSDGDGYTNMEEFVAGTEPGNRDSKPATH